MGIKGINILEVLKNKNGETIIRVIINLIKLLMLFPLKK